MSIKKCQRRLPVEYQEVEYLESTGMQYINTGVVPKITQRFECKIAITNTNNVNYVVLGSRTSGAANTSTDQVYMSFNNSSTVLINYDKMRLFVSVNAGYDYSISDTPVVADIPQEYNVAVDYLGVSITTATQPYYMFALNNIGNALANALAKIYYFKIYDGDTIIRDFVPVKRLSDNEAGMYDIVNNVFYTNQGTGSFSVGSDVHVWSPIPYRQYHANATSLTSDEITTDGSNISGLSIAGSMVQNGTPAPDNIIYPQECGDKTYNQLDLSKSELNCYYNENGIRIASDYHDTTDFRPVESGRAYTVYVAKTGATGGYGIYINLWDLDKEFYSNLILRRAMNGYYTFTSPINGYCRFNYLRRYGLTKDEMFYEDSRELPYKPYGYEIPITINNTTYSIYLNEPLRKIGDYADTINADGTVTRNIKKLVFDGTESWVELSTWSSAYRFALTILNSYTSDLTHGLMSYCSHLPLGEDGGTYRAPNCYTINNSTGMLYMRLDDDSMRVAAFKQYLADQYSAGTPVTVWYVLATPTTEQITLPSISTTSGQNILTVDTTLPPSDIKISNWWENKGYGSVVNNGDWHYSNSVDYLQSFSISQLQSKTVNELQGG